jgi:hypothetical protein
LFQLYGAARVRQTRDEQPNEYMPHTSRLCHGVPLTG